MADMSELVSGIEEKIYRLINIHQATLAETDKVRIEFESCKKKLEEQKLNIEELEKRLNVLKTVKGLENKEGTVEAKARINQLLREIDKCIGLLNV